MSKQQKLQQGFGYLFLLLFLAVFGVLLASVGQSWRLQAQREHEVELLFIGKQFSQALTHYYSNGPNREYPKTLEELLEDKRQPFPVHHLRRIWRDPFTGKTDWGLVVTNGRITGIYSQSEQTPLRSTSLPSYVSPRPSSNAPANTNGTYANWVFVAQQGNLIIEDPTRLTETPPTQPSPPEELPPTTPQ